MSRPRWSALIFALVLVALAGCGGDAADGPVDGEQASQGTEPGLHHIHGLGVSGETLLIATHTGLWSAKGDETTPQRVGSSRQDVMGFSVVDRNRFVGSGHPAPDQPDLPPNLGFIESRDGGRTWRTISLSGQADFHVLQSAGQHVYGVNSADGALMVSADGGQSWQKRTPPAGVFGLAIDPRSSRHIVVSTERGIFSSSDAGEGWRPLNRDLAGLLAWPAPDRLYLVGGDGITRVSSDSGGRWEAMGAIGGQPAAFIAHEDELYVALADATVKRSSDGGRSWALRAAP